MSVKIPMGPNGLPVPRKESLTKMGSRRNYDTPHFTKKQELLEGNVYCEACVGVGYACNKFCEDCEGMGQKLIIPENEPIQ